MENPEEFFNTICRVCLCYGNSEHMVSLTDNSSEDGLSMFGKSVFIFTNISMKNDSLPSKMCPKCLFLLKQAILFKKTCEKSNEKLLKFVRSIDKSDINFKRKLCDFVMFVDNFPVKYKSITQTIQPVPKIKRKNDIKEEKFKDKDVKSENIKNETAVVPDTFENYDNANFEDGLSYDNTDEKLVDTLSEEDDADNILTNMELLTECKTPIFEKYCKSNPKKSRDVPPKFIKKIKRRTKQKAAENENVVDKQKFKSEKDLQCTICSKTYANHHSLSQHMQRHTGGQYICEHCGRIFPTKGELIYHLASTHDIGHQFVCKECGLKFPKKYEFKVHRRIHTGERPYACDKCGLTFRWSYVWKRHALVHMDKTITCQLCPTKFYRNGDLVAHINNVHERLYIFACTHCDATYANNKSVRKHLAKKHGVPRKMQGKIKRIKLGNTSMRPVKARQPVEEQISQ